ncbi:MAG: phosphate propanoyltransferase [Elusimicrobia bacterium]|nr:phosphate propanoyltransferase [Elusimicrobiota bacterium]
MDKLTEQTAEKIKLREKRAQKPVIANVSNRHLHLCQEDMEKLFGKGYKLKKIKDLIQPGEFASKETVVIKGNKGEIKKVRVLGPIRKATQVEISRTDSFILGINAPLRISGDTKGSAPVTIIGPNGTVELKEGCIVARRHVHFSIQDADFFKVKDGENLMVRVDNERGLIFNNVCTRVRANMTLEFHIDTDEANAAGIKNGDKVIIL